MPWSALPVAHGPEVTLGWRWSTTAMRGRAATVGPSWWGRGIVKRWGSTTALDGATFEVGPGITGPARDQRRRQDHPAGHDAGPAPPQPGPARASWASTRSRSGAEVRERVGYSPEHHTLPARHHRPGPGPPHRRGPRPALPRGHRPGQRRAVAGGPGRGALPAHRHHVHRPAPAGQAGPGHRPRPPPGAARRAHRRARPRAARRHAGPHPPGRHRVRHRHHLVVAPARGGRAAVRRRRHPGRRPGGGRRRHRRAHRRRPGPAGGGGRAARPSWPTPWPAAGLHVERRRPPPGRVLARRPGPARRRCTPWSATPWWPPAPACAA